jgi:hypothetical protein
MTFVMYPISCPLTFDIVLLWKLPSIVTGHNIGTRGGITISNDLHIILKRRSLSSMRLAGAVPAANDKSAAAASAAISSLLRLRMISSPPR